MELSDYLRVIRRQWLMIVACLLLGIAGAAVVTVQMTPQYSSTARLFVSTPLSDSDNVSYQGAQFSAARVTSYADLIKGTTVVQKVIDKLHLDESATALMQQIDATAKPNTVILVISVTDPSPARAQQIAQATAEVFSDYVPTLEDASNPDQTPIRATIVDAATLPTTAVSPKPTLNIGLGAVLGLFVGLGLAFLRETLDTTIKSPSTLQELTKAASLGVVTADSDAPKHPLVTDLDTHAPRVESFRVLRTNLQFLDVDKPSKIFAITSPLPGEGKSTTAVNLAITLAQAGQRTLLLEADLRRPKVPEYLNVERSVGLTTVLIGRASLDDVIQPWRNIGLDVITSGAVPPNPAELLQSKAMDAVLAELRERYDIVIIDAPPLIPVTDTALIAHKTDGAILIARFGKTTRDQVAQAAARLESVDASLLGTITNFAPAKGGRGYGYGYGYGYYGYGYAPKEKAAKSGRGRGKGEQPGWETVTRPATAPRTATTPPVATAPRATTTSRQGIRPSGQGSGIGAVGGAGGTTAGTGRPASTAVGSSASSATRPASTASTGTTGVGSIGAYGATGTRGATVGPARAGVNRHSGVQPSDAQVTPRPSTTVSSGGTNSAPRSNATVPPPYTPEYVPPRPRYAPSPEETRPQTPRTDR